MGSKYWDDLTVESLSAPPSNTPTPTNTPPLGSTATPTNTPVPGNTATPTATNTAVPPPVTQQTVTSRLTIALAGQAYAVRTIERDADTNAVLSSSLHHLITDHLGSTQATVHHSNGALVAGSLARYKPFGEYRTAPTAGDTDRGFTGHLENRDIGLTYMNARYYVPAVGRFASADTIGPNPMNPQAFNRYSYVENNPIKYSDPSGHVCYDPGTDATSTGNCNGGTTVINELPPVPVIELKFDENGNFDPRATWTGLSDAELLARMMLSEESYKILDPILYQDAVGAAWTALNRTLPGSGYSYGEGDLLEILIASGQYHGMYTDPQKLDHMISNTIR